MICNACFRDKPPDAFYKHKAMKSGYLSQCKECTKARVRRHRQENLESIQEYDRMRSRFAHRREANRIRSKLYHRDHSDWIERNREKRNAHIAVSNAVRDGKLIRPERCEACSGTYGLHGHHDDYSKPLDVKWLCRFCHGERHRELNEAKRQEKRIAAE